MRNSIIVKNKIAAAEIIKVSPFRKEIRKTSPHQHDNYFEIIYLLEGEGIHTIDQVQYPITKSTIFFVRKEQVHHWDITTAPEGYVLLLKKGFVEHSLDSKLKDLISQLSGLSCLYLTETKSIELIFQLLINEKDLTVIEGLLKALLAKILIIAKPFSSVKDKTNNILLLFREQLTNTADLRNNVAHYAEKLNTTPQNLNVICRKVLEQSASQVISDHIISEAKRLLIYTDKNISEIAYLLSFHDTSHFIKYFKRYVGSTPQVFRNT